MEVRPSIEPWIDSVSHEERERGHAGVIQYYLLPRSACLQPTCIERIAV